MAYRSSDFSSTKLPPVQTHHHIPSRFQEPLECLAAHLMLECAEVLAGVKPASLISLTNRTRSCGRNLYQLWHLHHNELAVRLGKLNFQVFQTRESALLLLCYNPDHLDRHLSHPGIRALLAKSGYDTTTTSAELLIELGRRFDGNNSFPHEIGLFIGYPAKDVAAFMGLITIPFTCQGPWRIYGDPRQSLRLADTYRQSRVDMSCILTCCSSPFDSLERASARPAFF